MQNPVWEDRELDTQDIDGLTEANLHLPSDL